MKELRQEQVVIRQYLLGELDEESRQQVEQRVMTERDYKEEVLMSEEELLEDFAAGALGEYERELFLKHYLSAPLQKRKLKIAQALNKYSEDHPPLPAAKQPESNWRRLINVLQSRKWFLRMAWAVVVLVVIGGTWVVFQTWRGRNQQTELQAELERLNGPGSKVLEGSGSVLHLSLVPLSLREATGAPPLTVTAQTQIVQLRLAGPPGHFQSYRATLKDSHSDVVLSYDNLMVRNPDNAALLVLQLPARILNNDDYVLTLSGLKPDGTFEETGDYSFRVIVK